MNAREHIQAIVSIVFERVPSTVRAPFERAHHDVVVTRVIKETSTFGRVTYDVHFVDALGHPGHEVLAGARTQWSRRGGPEIQAK